jgi:hypothetical protein
MLEIKVSDLRQDRKGGQFLERAYEQGGGVVISAHPAGLHPSRKLVLKPVDFASIDKELCISARKLYANGIKGVCEAISQGKLYLRSAQLGVAFKMDVVDL